MRKSDFWKHKRVFVTGANGFLGAHVVRGLIAKGVRPVVLIYEDNPGGIFDQEDFASKTTVVRGSVVDLPLMEKIIREHKIDLVFHLAAQAIVDVALEDPLATFEANIKGTWNILEACKHNPGVKKIIVASSDKAYGEQETLPYVEDKHHLNGAYPYEVSKVCADLITQSFYKAYSLPVCITRCANLYGPGDLKMNRIVPRTVEQIFNGRPPIIRDTGESLRDYLFVGDAAEAYLLLAEKMDEKMFGHSFNFSTNKPLSASAMIKAITREMKADIAPKVVKTHGMEIKNQYASFDKARKILGWKPRHSLVEGLCETIPWYVAHLAGQRVHKTPQREKVLSR